MVLQLDWIPASRLAAYSPVISLYLFYFSRPHVPQDIISSPSSSLREPRSPRTSDHIDRVYHSFKNMPYANRRLIVQAVQYSEIQRYTRKFKHAGLTFTKINGKTRNKTLNQLCNGRRHPPHPVSSSDVLQRFTNILS
jgi:hypothetical protein